MRNNYSVRYLILTLILFLFLSLGCQSSNMGPTIQGVVTDKKGTPVAGAVVIISIVHGNQLLMPKKGFTVALTDSSGTYSINGGSDDTGRYRITVSDDNFEPANQVVDTSATTEANFILEPRLIYEQVYKVGDEVQALDIEWCPARITMIGTEEDEGRYEVEFLQGNFKQLIRARNIRPKNAGPMETHFSCPFLIKKARQTH